MTEPQKPQVEILENGRKVFYVDTGNLTAEQIAKHLEELKFDIKKKQIIEDISL